MQGQRNTVGSFPESMGFNLGSSSSDAARDQQIYWSGMRNTSQLSNYMLPPRSSGITYMNINQDRQTLSGWYLGEPSSSAGHNRDNHNERKTEDGLSIPLNDYNTADPTSEDQQCELSGGFNLNNANANFSSSHIVDGRLLMQRPNPDSIARDSATLGCSSDGCQATEDTNLHLSGCSENTQTHHPLGSSEPFWLHTGGGYLEEESDVRPDCSLDGRRSSCKRKAVEGHIGQSSGSGSSNFFNRVEGGSVWNAVPSQSNIGCNSLSLCTNLESPVGTSHSEQVNPSLGLGVGGSSSGSSFSLGGQGNGESSSRNFRARINDSHLQVPTLFTAFPGRNAVGLSNLSPANQSFSFLPHDSSLDLIPAPAMDNINLPEQSVMHVSSLRQSLESSRWNAGSSSRSGSSQRYLHSRDGDVPLLNSNARRMPRNVVEHPMVAPSPEIRNSSQNLMNWSLAVGNATSVTGNAASVAGNAASYSQTGSHSNVPAFSASNWVPNRSPQYSRRISEIVRRSLLSAAAGPELGRQSSNSPSLAFGPSSSQDIAPSGSSNQVPRNSLPRSTLLLERQLHGAFGASNSSRTLAAASEGRSRLLSEIRNVIDLMRRGEGLRIEDVMILDQSVFFGMPDYDRHRHMRLDIDNMSYEELLALEERIGNVCTGLSEDAVVNRLKLRKFLSINPENQQDLEPCCICQEEYNNGENLGELDCGHDFHADCIKQWLMRKNSCPICKMTGLNV